MFQFRYHDLFTRERTLDEQAYSIGGNTQLYNIGALDIVCIILPTTNVAVRSLPLRSRTIFQKLLAHFTLSSVNREIILGRDCLRPRGKMAKSGLATRIHFRLTGDSISEKHFFLFQRLIPTCFVTVEKSHAELSKTTEIPGRDLTYSTNAFEALHIHSRKKLSVIRAIIKIAICVQFGYNYVGPNCFSDSNDFLGLNASSNMNDN